jgi:Lon protease-like protein
MNDFPLNEEALSELPIFPLGQLVLFPNAFVPLHIFEPRYRAMVKHCMETHRAFAIAHVPDPSDVDAFDNPKLSAIAGVGVIVAHEEHADGRANILVRGKARVLLTELPFAAPFRRATATLLPDEGPHLTELDRTTLVSVSNSFVNELRKRDPEFRFNLPKEGSTKEWADICAHYLLIRSDVKQAVLEEGNIHRQLDIVVRELAKQTSAMQGEKTATSMN